MSKRVQVSLTIAEGADLQQVAEALRGQGLTVGQIMESLGIIQGEADEHTREKLRSTPQLRKPSRNSSLLPTSPFGAHARSASGSVPSHPRSALRGR